MPVQPTLKKRRLPLAEPLVQIRQLDEVSITNSFEASLTQSGLYPLRPTDISVFQINVGKRCNQTCHHCHVDAGPDRTEVMSQETMEHCIRVLEATKIPTLDITGGAPELHPNFRWLVQEGKRLGKHVIDRCNLTILLLPNYSDLPEFFAKHEVEIICSLPYYMPKQTDAQRGQGVFEDSIKALQRLNKLGYGKENSPLKLNLVTNPVGAFLPAQQEALEAQWKRELKRRYDISFHSLYTITNMPISRFLEFLIQSGNLEDYMNKLVNAYNPSAAEGVMCRYTLSVGWDGRLYDCDFNQMLDLEIDKNAPRYIKDFDMELLLKREIEVGPHCFGCTAGSGSSCGGSVA